MDQQQSGEDIHLLAKTVLSSQDRSESLVGISNSRDVLENSHHHYNNDDDDTQHEVDVDDMVTYRHGKPIKKPLLPNFSQMSKKEVAKLSLRTSKILILSVLFVVFGVVYSVFHRNPVEDTLHFVSIGEAEPKYIEFSTSQPRDILSIEVEVPIVGNDVIYNLRKQATHNEENHDWNLVFQIQKSMFDSEFINLSDQNYTIDFLPNFPSVNHTEVNQTDHHTSNHTEPHEPEQENVDEEESEIQAIKGSYTFSTDLSTLNQEEKKNVTYRLLITTSFPQNYTNSFAIKVNFKQQPDYAKYKVIYAALVLVFVYILIIFELVHRTVASMLGSFIVLAVMAFINQRPTLKEICEWMEYDTLTLLFGMMIMVGIFANTGFFEWIALVAYKLSKGSVWRLTVILCLFTAVVSAFLDNVTTILLVVPVTLRLCSVVNVSPIPIVISEVIFSNIGGVATAVGDPPIVIIVNHPAIKALNIGFLDISIYLAPCAVIIGACTILPIRLLNWNLFKTKPDIDNEKLQREKEIEIWEQTLRKTRGNGIEEMKVKESLQLHIVNLKSQLEEYLTSRGSNVNNGKLGAKEMKELSEQYFIHNPRLFIICSAILIICIIFFFLESFIHHYVQTSLAEVAIIGAITMLLLSGIDDLEEVIEKVEWTTLLFFGSLFILMEGLTKLGLIDFIGTWTSYVISLVPAGDLRLFVAITVLVWVSGIVSAFIDNLPYASAMIPIVLKLAEEPTNLPVRPILWALALGTCLGGNGTIIGASANVVAAGICENSGHKMGFVQFMKYGFPCMLLSLLISNIYLVILHVAIGVR
ncbi:predicted protein [Naegleria gruberi]|uniref:Predicted protein n=1 Tax=Naegleria gruberi TaxID=5762 RepID=D2VY56_NAEGR|nr:uncharacterized protein NAEGRDRAFT_73979 [Naegleria gruberi]EFC38266.1 predicted protein [Naegleria gruberi]|eukprot:XP_002671010.1 predicted protein [Naegleria gruberi strain NEG-M]